MDGTDWDIKSKLDGQWEEFLFRIEQLHNSVDFSNKQSPFDFETSTKDSVEFNCKTFSVNLPERAGASLDLPLFLVIRGKMTFDKAHFAASKEIRTCHFATETGYFRVNGDYKQLKHVYGAHYDLDQDLSGHPRFHAQHRSFFQFAGEVLRHLGGDIPAEDGMTGVLNTVRIPCAQMDVFAVLLQTIGDRLMTNNPSNQQKATFAALVARSKQILGCGYLFPMMSNPVATSCYRAPHWY